MAPGLYVHVPFCRSKCPYCGFYSLPSSLPVPLWYRGIQREALLYQDRFDPFDSLYLGGGTPTFLDDRTLSGLMGYLFTHLSIAPHAEVTIDANPGDISGQRARFLKGLGINRINLGVQSFDDRSLAFLGRRHTGEEARAALNRLRLAGFDNVGVDLIYGLPGQTLKGWVATLKEALSFAPEHIACYELTLEERTLFGRMREKGILHPLSEEEGRTFFLVGSDLLQEAGYIHYEVSNYAKSPAHTSRHNRKYWEHAPYLGLGPSAHSFSGNTRWWNVRSVRRYAAMLDRGSPPVEGRETLTEDQMRLESLALGFRTRKGVDLAHLLFTPQSKVLLSELESAGLLTLQNGRAVPTEEGLLVADQLPLWFFPC